jgi:hypothetical protein
MAARFQTTLSQLSPLGSLSRMPYKWNDILLLTAINPNKAIMAKTIVKPELVRNTKIFKQRKQGIFKKADQLHRRVPRVSIFVAILDNENGEKWSYQSNPQFSGDLNEVGTFDYDCFL